MTSQYAIRECSLPVIAPRPCILWGGGLSSSEVWAAALCIMPATDFFGNKVDGWIRNDELINNEMRINVTSNDFRIFATRV